MGSFTTAYIGVGTNLGDRIQNLIDARQQLNELAQLSALRCSSFYVSSPVGYVDQADFINCVFEVQWINEEQVRVVSTPEILFEKMQKIETDLGRVRDINNQNAARTIDLDLLSFGDQQSKDSKLILPHPRICERLFVLLPLLELNPNVSLPGLGSLASVLDETHALGGFGDQEIFKLGIS